MPKYTKVAKRTIVNRVNWIMMKYQQLPASMTPKQKLKVLNRHIKVPLELKMVRDRIKKLNLVSN